MPMITKVTQAKMLWQGCVVVSCLCCFLAIALAFGQQGPEASKVVLRYRLMIIGPYGGPLPAIESSVVANLAEGETKVCYYSLEGGSTIWKSSSSPIVMDAVMRLWESRNPFTGSMILDGTAYHVFTLKDGVITEIRAHQGLRDDPRIREVLI